MWIGWTNRGINLCSSLCHQYNRVQTLPLQDGKKAHTSRHIDIKWQTEIKGDGTSYSSVLIRCSGDADINLCSSLRHQYNQLQILPLQDGNKSTHFSSYRHKMAD